MFSEVQLASVGENACIIFHKHKYSHPDHQHARIKTLGGALRGIRQHDKWRLNGRALADK